MEQYPVSLRFLNKAEVDALLDPEDVYAACEETFRADGLGEMRVPPKEIMRFGAEGRNGLVAMVGALDSLGTAGVKWTNFYPCRPVDYPTLWAQVLVLSDTHTGLPLAVMAATSITNLRTAGGHALVAAKYLANPASRVLSILGCGAQGRIAAEAFDRAFPLEEVRLLDGNPQVADRLKRNLEKRLRARVVLAADCEALAAGCDILLAATTSKTPLLLEGMVPPGCTVLAMYSFNDVDPALSAACDKWVVGHWGTDVGQIVGNPDFGGRVREEQIYATLGQVVTGQRPGREREDERIVYAHIGMCTLDLAVARRVLWRAEEQGIGQVLRLA